MTRVWPVSVCENTVLPVGHQFIEVVAPTREGTAGGRYLERRHGDGGYMVITHTDDHEAVRHRVSELGVRTVLEFDHDGYQCLQLHPADTGGSFLEIDRQEGGEDPAGRGAGRPRLAGGHTHRRRRRHRRGPDPGRRSERRRGPVVGDHRHPGDRGRRARPRARQRDMRFVPSGDDRGDGLAAIELHAVDAEAAQAAAEQRG